jgi:Domain of unknown function (DUF4175)
MSIEPPSRSLAPDLAGKPLRWRIVLGYSRCALWLERLWPVIALPLIALALFLGLASIGLWQASGGLVRVGVLIALAGWIGWRLYRRPVPWPGRLAAMVRQDVAARLVPGQIASLLDGPASLGSPAAQRLWERHISTATRQLDQMRPFAPRLALFAHDRFGLLPLAALLLTIGILSSDGAWRDRLGTALSPDWRSFADVQIGAAIDPPAYVQAAPQGVALAIDGSRTVSAMQGSVLRLTVQGMNRRPRLVHDQLADAHFLPGGEGRWTAMLRLERDDRIRIRTWARTLSALEIALTPDLPPQVQFTAAPAISANQALDLRYRLSDDHGVASLALAYGRKDRWRAVMLPEPQQQPGITEGQSFRDLTEDAWAGEIVTLQLVAKDAGGNLAFSQTQQLRLPERVFSQPLAREIISLRKQLLRGGLSSMMGGLALEQLSASPERFGHDLTVFLGLRAAMHRLTLNPTLAGRASSAAMLWQIALDLDGQQAAAGLEDVRAAFEALQQGMGKPGDMRQLADQLERALSDFLASQMRNAAALPPAGAADDVETLDAAVLDQLFAALRERLAAGDMAGAAQIASALLGLMENLRVTAPADAQAMRAAQDRVRQLTALRDQQQALISRGGGSANDQRALGAAAGRLQQNAARDAMMAAASALSQGKPGAPFQQQALKALETALEAARAQLSAMARAGGNQPMPKGVDPLGRLGPGALDGRVRSVLPDASAAARSRAIRRLLEERAADPARPQAERDYLLRLLERF